MQYATKFAHLDGFSGTKGFHFIRAESEGVALLQSGFPIIHNGERMQYGSLYHSFLVSATTADDSKTGYPILLGQEAINKV